MLQREQLLLASDLNLFWKADSYSIAGSYPPMVVQVARELPQKFFRVFSSVFPVVLAIKTIRGPVNAFTGNLNHVL